jgi:glucose-1-phosphate adenylyltransferase
VLGIVMAGGRGDRLQPLTRARSKAAVPFGGRQRIIDYVLSNFVNSGIYALYVLVQYKAQSLIEHLGASWRIGGRLPETFVTVVPPQMRSGEAWFRGTADAVFQNVNLIQDFGPDLVAVFGADHIYRMDLAQMIEFHLANKADATVAALPVPLAAARGFGIIAADTDGRITGFAEKPAHPEPMPNDPSRALGSMGNYIFRSDLLVDLVTADAAQMTDHDFGRTILPALFKRHRVFAYNFLENRVPGIQAHEERGYWRDVGTIPAYYAAHQDLLGRTPAFDLDNGRWPIYTRATDASAVRVIGGEVENSLLGEGTIIDGARVARSILGRGVRVQPGAVLDGAIVMDHCEVGEGATIARTIVDRFNRIPAGARLEPEGKATPGLGVHLDPAGILVVPRGEPAGPLPQ